MKRNKSKLHLLLAALTIISGSCVHAMDGLEEVSRKKKLATNELWHGIRQSKPLLVQSSLANGADVNGKCDSLGKTPLLHALDARNYVKPGGDEVVMLLLEAGADVTLCPQTLQLAIKNGLAQGTICALIHAGADVNARLGSYRTPLECALDCGRSHNPVVVRALIEAGARVDNPDLLIYAARQNETDVVRALIEAGATVHGNPHLKSPLLIAMQAGNFDVAHVLIDAGAVIDGLDGRGMNPLDFQGVAHMLPQLVAAGADLHGQDRPPLHDIINHAHNPYLASIRIRDARRAHEIEQAVIEDMQALIAAGADVNAYDRSGRTPLDHTAEIPERELREQIVEILHKAGAEMTAQSCEAVCH